ncbi:hypothetical protein P3T35_002371 [Kitasatospora sp. GP30]|nr:hypothetical protein [Kitasatospora sp. GP30]
MIHRVGRRMSPLPQAIGPAAYPAYTPGVTR